MTTLNQLQREYGERDVKFVEITDRADALSQINGRTAPCIGAGQRFGQTGWIQLASPSKQHREDTRTIFVCRESLIA